MKMSTRGRYALRAMMEIVQCEKDGPVSLKNISKTQDISKKYLGKLFNELKKSRLLISVRGPKGGYLLGKKAEKITIGDIILAVEGPIIQVPCVENSTGRNCTRLEKCVCHLYWETLEKHITDFLDSETLLDLHNKTRKHNIAS